MLGAPMPTQPRQSTWLVLLFGAFWLSAGPGRESLQALLGCTHDPVGHAHSAPHAPTPGPCFCDEMTGGFDQALSPAAPTLGAVPVVATAAELDCGYPLLFPLPPSPSLTPDSPPPILLA